MKKVKMLCLLLVGIFLLGGCGSGSGAEIKIGALKGPTTIGLLRLMEKAEDQEIGRTEN